MRTGSVWARQRFATARVAYLATCGTDRQPHLVPVVFAATGDAIYTAVDGKPKSGAPLRRLTNIAANPAVSLLVDGYAEDWTQLWWARADGTAQVLDAAAPAGRRGIGLLVDRYPPYSRQPPAGPVLEIVVHRWSGWSGAR